MGALSSGFHPSPRLRRIGISPLAHENNRREKTRYGNCGIVVTQSLRSRRSRCSPANYPAIARKTSTTTSTSPQGKVETTLRAFSNAILCICVDWCLLPSLAAPCSKIQSSNAICVFAWTGDPICLSFIIEGSHSGDTENRHKYNPRLTPPRSNRRRCV